MLAGSLVEKEPIMFATLGGAIGEGELALIGGLVIIGAGRTNFDRGDGLNDVR